MNDARARFSRGSSAERLPSIKSTKFMGRKAFLAQNLLKFYSNVWQFYVLILFKRMNQTFM
jgi:hypothetical protein